jgi:uncharacterized membrane protein YdbT with pleckstrin-like domain
MDLRYSRKAGFVQILVLVVVFGWLALGAWQSLGVAVAAAYILIALVIGVPLWLFNRCHVLRIDSDKVAETVTLLSKRVTTIEANKIEGVGQSQFIFGRILGYGKLTVSGTGGKNIRTVNIDSPEQVAERIRSLNRATGVTAPAPQLATAEDMEDSLRKLAALREEGLLTPEEFAAQKAKLLGS